jgi:hypothetical protein
MIKLRDRNVFDRGGSSRTSLWDRASNLRKDSISVSPNESNCADDDYQNDGKHYSVFSDVLAFLI